MVEPAAMTLRTQRLRDPVHGLIIFEENDNLAQLAWKLINTPEFQRLRRIKQLGVSEFVFPSAVHTRFAHSIGVFHTARELVRIIKRESTAARPLNGNCADVATIAALLHDLGHGPFSHTFERVQASRGVGRQHEKWTAEIIRNTDGAIRPLLEAHRAGITEEVASLLAAEDPIDIYHAVVSSSFDADRLDYLRRDRLMTGTGAGRHRLRLADGARPRRRHRDRCPRQRYTRGHDQNGDLLSRPQGAACGRAVPTVALYPPRAGLSAQNDPLHRSHALASC